MEYFKEINASIMICDKEGIILAMNDKAGEIFKNSGGKYLIGKNIYDCHPTQVKKKLTHIIKKKLTNIYTIEKDGIKKLIYQTPWYENKKIAGLMEIAIELPAEIPHFLRK